jgi:MFS family permease
MGDFVLFSAGLAFYDPFVVVPAFVKTFAGSELLVGMLSALRVLMITLPQIWAASVLVARPRKKPLLVWSSIGGRLPVLFLALATLLWADRSPWLVVGVLSAAVVLFFISEGLNSISWPAIVGKAIPTAVRGRFFGFGQLFSSLGALGAGLAVRTVLGQEGSPASARWATLFVCAFAGFILSVACMLFIYEEAEEKAPVRIDVVRSLQAMIGYLRADGRLRRDISLFCDTCARSLFLVMQNLGGVAAALVCGQLIDRVGSWSAIRTGTAVQVASLLTVTLVGWGLVPPILYLAAFFLLGFVSGSSWWSFSAYLLDMANDERRPIYLVHYQGTFSGRAKCAS